MLLSFSAQGETFTEAHCVAVFDDAGTRVGRSDAVGAQSPGSGYIFWEHSDNRVLVSSVSYNAYLQGTTRLIYYLSSDCTGDPYLQTHPLNYALVSAIDNATGTVYLGDPTSPPQQLSVLSRLSQQGDGSFGACEAASSSNEYFSPATIHPGEFSPFTPPFHLRAESCFSAPPVPAMTLPQSLAIVLVLAAGIALWRRKQESA